jgi:hypothetical protein
MLLVLREGHASPDRGAAAGLRLDRKIAPHQLEPLSHADQPEASPLHRSLPVKTYSHVTHTQADLLRCSAQINLKVLSTAMLNRILQRFL